MPDSGVPWYVRLAALTMLRSDTVALELHSESHTTAQDADRTLGLDNLWRAYAAASSGGATIWGSIIQVVVFSIAAGGIIASGVVLALSSSTVAADAVLSFWMYVLLSGGWWLIVLLGGTYYLLTFGGMLRIGRHVKKIECLFLDADPSIDPESLFEHSPHVGRGTSRIGYVVAAGAALIAAVGPQLFFHGWWAPELGVPCWGQTVAIVLICLEATWLIGYGVAVIWVNQPAKCSAVHPPHE